MAEADKGTDSSSKAKENVSVLDDDISKNFLGSWNTNIGAESDDSSMDFKFEPVKGKKKDFSFDKLDMDFSLDGEFDKIKSFKVDMGDLDFSSPPKKTSTKAKETALDFSPPKTSTKCKGKDLDFSSPLKEGTKGKERLEGDSAKSNQGNQDCFAFSFDFNELDKFDLDAVLPGRTKELNKDEGNRGVKIHSTDKREDQGSKMHLADTDAGDDGALKARTMPVKAKNSKENLVACGGDLDLIPEINPSKSSTLQDKIESKQSKTISERENTQQRSPVVNTHQRSPVVKKTCDESYEESQLQNPSAQNVQDQTQSKPSSIVSEGPITDHAQRIDKQSDQVASFFNKSYEKPQVQNQPAWSLMDKISAFSVSEQMQTTSAGDNLGDADSKMQDLNPKVDPSFTLENEYFPVKKMTLQDDSKRLQNIPEVESEDTDGENNVPENCNVLHGDTDTAVVAENVLHVKGSPVADPSKLGAHVAESISGRQNTPAEIASSRVVRFNLKPITKDKIPASTEVLPRSNLVSLNKNAIFSMHPSPSGASISYRHSPHSARSRSKFEKSSGSFTQEEIGESFASENNTKSVSGQRAREDCNATVTQMKINLGAISGPNDGKAAKRGTTFLENEKKKEDTKSSSFQVQSSTLPGWTSESKNQGPEKLTPKIQSLQVRKLKMDTIVGKLSTLKVSKKLSDLKTASSPALEDKLVIAKKLDSNGMNMTTKTVQLVGSGKSQPPTPSSKAHSLASSTKTVQIFGSGKQRHPTPSYKAKSLAPSIKRKISEVSDAAPIISHPSIRLSASQRRNSKEDSEGVAQEEVGVHENIPDYSLNGASEKQPESTFEMALEMKFADLGVTPVMENDETIEKAEACGKELDQICIMLRKKQEEAKELLVRALVTNNKLLLLSNPMHALKLCQTQNLASRLLSKELPSRYVEQAM